MSVTVGEILAAARAGLGVLTSETVGYLVLGAADRVCQASPASFDANDIELDERGTVTVPGVRPAAQDQSEPLLRAVLRELLAHAPQGAPALARAGGADRTTGRLVGEIEAALIPVNRSAARRALARLHRDVRRARDSGTLARVSLPAIEPPAIRDEVVVSEREPVQGTPIVELPPVEARPVELPEVVPWEASVAATGSSATYHPEATPFLGAWPVVIVEAPEHDTDHVPPATSDEPAIPLADRRDVTETTQVLFVTSTERTQPLPVVRMDAPVGVPDVPLSVEPASLTDDALVIGPAWTPVVAAEAMLVAMQADAVDHEMAVEAEELLVEEEPALVAMEEELPLVELDEILVGAEAAPMDPGAEAAIAEVELSDEGSPNVEETNDDAWIVSLLASDEESPSPTVTPDEEDPAEPDFVAAESDFVAAEPDFVEDQLAVLTQVEAGPAVLLPAPGKGWLGPILAPAAPFESTEAEAEEEPLLDGAAIAFVPQSSECAALTEPTDEDPVADCAPDTELADQAGSDAEAYAEVDVTYDDEEPEPAPMAMAPSSPAPPEYEELLVDDAAVLDWVVRDEALYGELLGVQCDGAEEAEVHEDIGEMDWIGSDEALGETPCEVPIAKYDPREAYEPKVTLGPFWDPSPELDPDVIDAGWDLEEDSPAPSPVVVRVVALPEPFSAYSPTPPPYQARQSDVSELLAGFVVAEARSLREMSRELKLIAGVAVTPAPPAASPLAAGGGGVETSLPCTSRTWPFSRDS